MPPIFDLAWRTRALAGEPAAVQALAEAVLRPLYCFCFYRLGRNRHLCEEVVQETLVRALRDLGHYQPDRSSNQIFPWLTGLARNEIQRTLGREKAGVSLDALWARMDQELLTVIARLDSEPIGEDLLIREETRELVNATMSQLPPHYRETLEAKYVAGQSIRAIAEQQHLSEKAAESLLVRARKAFRATFVALAGNLRTELCFEP